MAHFRITPENLEDRFWAKVVRQPDGCWIWRNSDRHRTVYYPIVILPEGRRGRAHRLAWQLTNGVIPAGMFVCHTCDNPPCVNPDHLFLGTNADNMLDMAAKGRDGRTVHPDRYAHLTGVPRPTAKSARGERHGRHKLTREQVESIRGSSGSQRDIAARFGVSQGTVSHIVTGKNWTEAPR